MAIAPYLCRQFQRLRENHVVSLRVKSAIPVLAALALVCSAHAQTAPTARPDLSAQAVNASQEPVLSTEDPEDIPAAKEPSPEPIEPSEETDVDTTEYRNENVPWEPLPIVVAPGD